MTPFEKKVADKFTAEGWTVLNSGWPDFLIFKETEKGLEVKLIEAKTEDDKLRENQKKMLKVLDRFLPVRIALEGAGYGDNEEHFAVLCMPRPEV